jgi:protein required for attachment to host cells
MKETAVVLADARRARLFEVSRHRGQAGAIEPELVELCDLVQPERRLRPGERLSETRPGSRQAGPGHPGSGHAVDDGRDANIAEGDRRFASEVAAQVAALCKERSIKRLLVVAPPRFAGHLRAQDVGAACGEVEVITLDLSGLTPPRALAHLQRSGHLAG